MQLTSLQRSDLETVRDAQLMTSRASAAKKRLAGWCEQNLQDLVDGIKVKGLGLVKLVLKRELHVYGDED